jgi:hypothetical protein
VYDCNYTAGERYYRPVVESLDRKNRPISRLTPDNFSTLRPTLAAEEFDSPNLRRPRPRLDDDFDVEEPPRRNANSALIDEFDSIFENRNRTLRGERSPNRSLRSAGDETDQEISSFFKRAREARPARPTLEDEFEAEVAPRGSKRRPIVDFQEKLLDSVGVDKTRLAIEDDPFFKKRTLRVTSEDDEEAPSLTKWTSLNRRSLLDGDTEDFGSAAARARQSRSRLQDLDAEIEELAGRSAAREKRAAQLRALVKENEENSTESSVTSSRVVQRAAVRAEKKKVTF